MTWRARWSPSDWRRSIRARGKSPESVIRWIRDAWVVQFRQPGVQRLVAAVRAGLPERVVDALRVHFAGALLDSGQRHLLDRNGLGGVDALGLGRGLGHVIDDATAAGRHRGA